jgi:hypothetical protein
MKPKILIPAIIVIILLAVAFGGYLLLISVQKSSPAVQNTPAAAPTVKTPETVAKQETIAPLQLQYVLKNFGPGKSITISYFFEKKQQCNNRDAYLGIAKLESIDQKSANQYAKLTAFVNNGELGISNWSNEENMAFDNSTPYYDDMNIPLLVSELFINAGKNFNSSEYWQSQAPIILKDVATGRSKGDYSIINQGDDSSAIIPCTKFKIIAKTTSMDGYFNVCVTKKIKDVNLPFVVYMNFQNEDGPSWRLTNIGSQKSGIAWTPQCLEAPKCAYAPELSTAEQNQCQQQKGQVQPDMDKNGCIMKYECVSETDLATEAIARTQNPSCSVNQKLLDKYMACRKNNQPNYDPVKYDNNGCLQDITCRP